VTGSEQRAAVDACREAPRGEAPPTRLLLAAVGTTSLAAVYLEVSLMKLVSVMYYSIFVYAVIAVALLGFGAAGTALALAAPASPGTALRRMARCCIGFSAAALPTFLAVNAIDVPAAVLFGSLRGLPLLLLVYLLLTVPFLLLGLAIASAFAAFPEAVNRLYFADLLGAGTGSALAIASVPWLGGLALLTAAGLLGAIGGRFASRAAGRRGGMALALAGINLALLVVFAGWHPFDVHVAPDKHGPIQSRAVKPGGLAVPFSRWSAYGRIDVTEPFRSLPLFGGDLSPRFGDVRIEQRMLTVDGAAPAFLYRVDGAPGDLDFLAGTSQSAVYRLRPRPHVLVIGVGGATDILIALHQGATRVRGVELNAVTAEAVRDVFGPYVGNVLRDPRVELVVAEGRNFVARDRDTYDIVQLSGVDTGVGLGAAGLGTMPESYLYTVEAMTDFLRRLAPEGILSITRDIRFGWAQRLCAIARAALLNEGLDPTSRIAVLEGKMWGWATVLVKREPFTPTEVDSLREFADRYDFPLVYDPLVPGSGIFDRVVRGGVEREDDMDLRPSTDDWPFFFLNIPWMRLLPALRAQPSPLTNPIAFLLTSLAGLVGLAVLLIAWPLWRRRREPTDTRAWAMIGYFVALGAGFMLVEVALMQRFTVFLGNPALAVATVLAVLLVSSGLGSYSARAWRVRGQDRLPLAITWIIVMLLFFASPFLRTLLHQLLWMPSAVRLAVAAILVGLVGFAMGIPFPTGLARVAEHAKPLVPWGWGINGVASVVASLGSYLLGMVVGYTPMFYLGAALYGGALALARRL
jgi:hypothetical protein